MLSEPLKKLDDGLGIGIRLLQSNEGVGVLDQRKDLAVREQRAGLVEPLKVDGEVAIAARCGHSSRVPHEYASKFSSAHSGHRMRANPFSKDPQSRYRWSCSSTSSRQYPYRRSHFPSQPPFTSSKCVSKSRYRGVARGFRVQYRVAQTSATATVFQPFLGSGTNGYTGLHGTIEV